MEKPRAFITKRIPEAGVKILESAFDVAQYAGADPIPPTVLRDNIRGATALIPLLTDRIDAAVMESAGPTLKVIANLAVGFDNIDVPEATRRGIWVTNTPGVLTEATADLTWALILAVTRRIVPADRHVREGRFTGWDPLLFAGMELCGKTLGIIGFGRIGSAVARRAGAFGMKVIYFDPTPPSSTAHLGVECRPAGFDAIVERSDIVSLHLPFTPEAAGMFGKETFARMKRGAYFINTARGKLHDEAALVGALVSGHLRGAGLDVYEQEPRIDPALLRLDNVVVLPHIGSATEETRSEMSRIAARNCLAALDGTRPPQAINNPAR